MYVVKETNGSRLSAGWNRALSLSFSLKRPPFHELGAREKKIYLRQTAKPHMSPISVTFSQSTKSFMDALQLRLTAKSYTYPLHLISITWRKKNVENVPAPAKPRNRTRPPFSSPFFQIFLANQAAIHMWPAWLTSLTTVSHLALAINSSTNLLLYCFCDKHFWVLAQKRFKSGVVWPFIMRDAVIYKFDWARKLKRYLGCRNGSTPSSTSSVRRGAANAHCAARRCSSTDVYCSCEVYDVSCPVGVVGGVKKHALEPRHALGGHAHAHGRRVARGVLKEVVVLVDVDNESASARGSLSRVTEVTEL